MSLKSRMAEENAKSSKVNAVREALHRNERDYRLDKRVDAWSAIPEIGLGMKEMSESKARNLACNLDNQAAHMSRLSETQLATGFNNFKPENMLRLVRLAMLGPRF